MQLNIEYGPADDHAVLGKNKIERRGQTLSLPNGKLREMGGLQERARKYWRCWAEMTSEVVYCNGVRGQARGSKDDVTHLLIVWTWLRLRSAVSQQTNTYRPKGYLGLLSLVAILIPAQVLQICAYNPSHGSPLMQNLSNKECAPMGLVSFSAT